MLNIIQRKYRNLTSDTRFSEILTGSAWALWANILATVFGLVFNVIVARLYGAQVVGIVAVINSYLILVTTFTVLGTGTSILRLIPEHLAKYSPSSAFDVYRKTQYLVVGVSLVTGVFAFWGANLIAVKMFSKPHLSVYFASASVFVVFKSMTQLNTQAVRGLRLIKVFSAMQVIPQAASLVLLGVFCFLGPENDAPIFAFLGGFAIAGVLGSIIMEYAFKKRKRPSDFVKSISMRKIFSISLPMMMTGTMTFIIGQTGVIMLGMFASEADVGYYSTAVKLATLTSFILQAVNSMAGPKFSELFHSDKMDELFYIAKKSAKLVFYFSTPILLILVILGKYILVGLYGHEFVSAYQPLIFLVIGQFVNAISGSSGVFLNMTGRQNQFSKIMIIAAILNFCLNLILIPRFSLNGAAISAMICLSFWNIVTLVYMKIKFGKTTGYFPVFAE